jgi:membrane-associated phospholipid phosphatase
VATFLERARSTTAVWFVAERLRVTPSAGWARSAGTVTVDQRTRAWYRGIGSRVRRELVLKAIGTPGTILVFLLLYRHLLNHPLFPVTEMPLTALDHIVGFFPPALLLYGSLWLYVSLPPSLLESRQELLGYAWAIGAVCLIGLLCFLVWPTMVPPLSFDRGRHPGFGALQGLDAAGNACPSLHVATALFSAVWLAVLLREMGAGWVARGASWAWGLGIVYSAMATKQHVALDVLAGAVLGLAGAALSIRYRAARPRPAGLTSLDPSAGGSSVGSVADGRRGRRARTRGPSDAAPAGRSDARG